MKYRILIPLEPISINKVHCRDTRYTTTHFKDFAANVLNIISNDRNQKSINNIKQTFDPSQHYLKLSLTFFYPRSQFWTESNQISSKTHDISNIEKPLIDVLFTPKFYGSGTVMKGPNLNLDDKYIKEMSSKQRCADSHLIEIEIEIRPLDELESNVN